MKIEHRTQFQNALSFGLILGLVFIIIGILSYIFNLQAGNFFLQIINILINIGILVWGIKSYREKGLNGYISYGRALGTGVLIALISAVIIAIFNYIFFKFVDVGYMDRMLEISEEEMLERGMSDEQIAMALEMSRRWMSPLWMSIMTLFSLTFWGFIISLIVSAFLQKKEKI